MLAEVQAQLRICNDRLAQAWVAAKKAGNNRLADRIKRTWDAVAADLGDTQEPETADQNQAA